MSKKLTCEFCNREFKSKGALKTHIETICKRSEDLEIKCKYCNCDFSRKNVLDRHLKNCQKKIEWDLINQLQNVQTELNEYKTEKITNLTTIYEQKINELKFTCDQKNTELTSFYEQKIQELTLSYEQKLSKLGIDHENFRSGTKQMIESLKEDNISKDKKIEYLRGQLKICKENQNKPTHITTNYNNNSSIVNNNLFIQNLEPITDELIEETGKKVGMLDLKDGAPGIIRKFQPALKDKIICTDATRNSLMYNYNGKLKRDARGQMITDKIISSTEHNYDRFKDEVKKYYEALNDTEMTETEREINDNHFENYKEYVKALKSNSEFSKKKVSNKMSKSIVRFSKSKAQFEQSMHEDQKPQIEELESTVNTSSLESECKTDGKLNPVASRKQTLINGRIFELHLDAQGQIIRKIRIRSSGLPYLTDEETDPSSREQSDNEVGSD